MISILYALFVVVVSVSLTRSVMNVEMCLTTVWRLMLSIRNLLIINFKSKSEWNVSGCYAGGGKCKLCIVVFSCNLSVVLNSSMVLLMLEIMWELTFLKMQDNFNAKLKIFFFFLLR